MAIVSSGRAQVDDATAPVPVTPGLAPPPPPVAPAAAVPPLPTVIVAVDVVLAGVLRTVNVVSATAASLPAASLTFTRMRCSLSLSPAVENGNATSVTTSGQPSLMARSIGAAAER